MNTIGTRKLKLGNSLAFTLVELLVVIAIIGILAAMLLTGIPAAITAAKKAKAKTEMSQIVNAIEAYDQAYSRFPISTDEQAAAKSFDFTTGLVPNPQPNITWTVPAYSYDNNSNVIAILMDLQTYGNGVNTTNYGHVYNPKQTKFLNAKMVSDTTLPGVGPDGVYRDPWGNPYIITMNTSYNEQGTSDLFYSRQSVSQQSGQTGFYGLFNPTAGGNSDNFLFHGKVMVWSAGPDKKIDYNTKANLAPNKDNVLSWQ